MCYVCEAFSNDYSAFAMSFSRQKDFSFGPVDANPIGVKTKTLITHVMVLIVEGPKEIKF